MSFLSSIASFVLAIETPPDTVRSISVNMRPHEADIPGELIFLP